MAEKININNYEIYAIDYIEGNLKAEIKSEFEAFLNDNPQIKDEISDLGGFSFNPDDVVFENKSILKKSPVDGLTYNEYLIISDVESEISKNEKQELKIAFENDEKIAIEYSRFKKSKLPNEFFLFNKKIDTKKSLVEGLSYEEYLMISNIEKTLNENEKNDFNILIQNSDRADQIKAFEKTILQKENIVYPNKKALKRSNIVTFKRIRNTIVALAAMFILFLGLKLFFLTDKNYSSNAVFVSMQNTKVSEYNFKRSQIELNADTLDSYTPVQDEEVIVDNNFDEIENIDDDYIENIIADTNYEYYVFEEIYPTKKIDYSVSSSNNVLDNNVYSNDFHYFMLDYNDDKINPAEEVVNFVFDKIKDMTESDKTLKVDFDKDNKCYGIEYNDKSYSLCLK